jgi:hypothetical protein
MSIQNLKHGEWEGELLCTTRFVKLSITFDKKPYCLIEFRRSNDESDTWEKERRDACISIWNLYLN